MPSQALNAIIMIQKKRDPILVYMLRMLALIVLFDLRDCVRDLVPDALDLLVHHRTLIAGDVLQLM